MNAKHVDAGLTTEQLDDKYNSNGYGEHPDYTRSHWRDEVAAKDTLIGYWDWVVHRIGVDTPIQTASGLVYGEEGGIVISEYSKPDSSALEQFLAKNDYRQDQVESALLLVTKDATQAKRITAVLQAWPGIQDFSAWWVLTLGFIRPPLGEYLCGPIPWGEVQFSGDKTSPCHRISIPIVLSSNNTLILELPRYQVFKKIEIPE